MSWAHGLTGWYGSCIRRKGFGSEIVIEPPTAGSTAYSYWLTDILLRIWYSLIEYPSASYGHYDEHRNRNGDLRRPGKREGSNTAFPQTSVNRVHRRTDAGDLQWIRYMLRQSRSSNPFPCEMLLLATTVWLLFWPLSSLAQDYQIPPQWSVSPLNSHYGT